MEMAAIVAAAAAAVMGPVIQHPILSLLLAGLLVGALGLHPLFIPCFEPSGCDWTIVFIMVSVSRQPVDILLPEVQSKQRSLYGSGMVCSVIAGCFHPMGCQQVEV